VHPLSYATVRDYCDSFENLSPLATKSGDLKDVQRPWMIKAVLGSVPRGARLLEIGAGEPIVADLLARLGYQLTVVDPYDGSGNGPREYEYFRATYPHIRFLREELTEAVTGLEPASFDCVYSISVIEHIPIPQVPRLCAGIKKFLIASTGITIHAIDHVLMGQGDLHHLERLFVLADCLGFEKSALVSLLKILEDDVETYFLSAEGHNRWRGKTRYDDFPMRRVVSLQLALPLPGSCN
jgi:Methyltransferase domain